MKTEEDLRNFWFGVFHGGEKRAGGARADSPSVLVAVAELGVASQLRDFCHFFHVFLVNSGSAPYAVVGVFKVKATEPGSDQFK